MHTQAGPSHSRTGSWGYKGSQWYSRPTYLCFSPRRWPSMVLFLILSTCVVVITLQYQIIVRQQTLLVLDPSVRRVALSLKNIDPDTLHHISIDILSKDKTPDLSTSKDNQVLKTKPATNSTLVRHSLKTKYPITIYRPYILNNPRLCSSVPDLDVLVIVHSAPNHFERRLSMRSTWANDTYYRSLGRLKILFLLGRVHNTSLQEQIEREFSTHSDILQGDFVDAYRNLTHKGVMGYRWITERCRNAKIILKTDDDIVVNSFKFFTEVIPQFKNKSKQIFCNHIFPGTMPIIRKNNSKWYVDENEFKGHNRYPRYCSGFMVMFTNDVIPAIFRATTMTPFFWVDDVYLYGMAPGRVPGIKYNGLKKGSHQLTGPKAIQCYTNTSKTCDFLVTGAGKRTIFEKTWQFMTEQYTKSIEAKVATTSYTLVASDEDVSNSSVENGHVTRKTFIKDVYTASKHQQVTRERAKH